MKNKIIFVISLFCFSLTAYAQETQTIYDDAYLFYKNGNAIINFTMNIHLSTGTKERGMEVYLCQESREWKLLARITEPGFLRNMKYLVRHESDGDESKWLKTSNGVKRISGFGQDESLFGSDFSVADISAGETQYESLVFLGTEVFNGRPMNVIEMDCGDKFYAKKTLYIDKENSLIHQVLIYSAKGELIKKYELLEWKLNTYGATPVKSKMTTIKESTFTELLVDSFEIRETIPERIFNRGNL